MNLPSRTFVIFLNCQINGIRIDLADSPDFGVDLMNTSDVCLASYVPAPH